MLDEKLFTILFYGFMIFLSWLVCYLLTKFKYLWCKRECDKCGCWSCKLFHEKKGNEMDNNLIDKNTYYFYEWLILGKGMNRNEFEKLTDDEFKDLTFEYQDLLLSYGGDLPAFR